MIESLSVVVAKDLLDRSPFRPEELSSFESLTGIRKTRRWPGRAIDLAMEAVKGDMERIRGARIGALVYLTQSPERSSPAMANDIARFLELPTYVPVFDVNQSCSGFVYGLWIASQLTEVNGRVLLVCSDMLRARDGLDSLIFSDAAAACVVSGKASDAQWAFHTDGSGAEKLCADPERFLKMDGGAVFDFVTKTIPPLIKGMPSSDILVQHQANESMMKMVERRSGFDGRSVHTIGEYGNMSMCSIPVACAAAEAELVGRIVTLCGYGAGWSAAACRLRWPSRPLARIREV